MATSIPVSASFSVASPAGPWRRSWWRLRRDRVAIGSALAIIVLAGVGVFVPLLLQIDPYAQSLRDSLLPPFTAGHFLGTDQFGRDLLLRLIDGARVSLTVGLIAVLISVGIGSVIGLAAGHYGSGVDTVLMRIIDVKLAFPGILLALVIIAVLGTGLEKAMIAVGIGGIPRYARVVRGAVLGAERELYVEAARSVGVGDVRLMALHIVPNVFAPILTLATFGIGSAILSAAALSFLGLGAQPPAAEWGLTLAEARRYLRIAWWLAVFPGLAIMLTVLAINLLGDALRDALDPRIASAAD